MTSSWDLLTQLKHGGVTYYAMLEVAVVILLQWHLGDRTIGNRELPKLAMAGLQRICPEDSRIHRESRDSLVASCTVCDLLMRYPARVCVVWFCTQVSMS